MDLNFSRTGIFYLLYFILADAYASNLVGDWEWIPIFLAYAHASNIVGD
jgi:hypothetical protein